MIRKIICINLILTALLAVSLFIFPPLRAIVDIQDPGLKGPGISKAPWRLYQNLTPRYAAWARERVAQGHAQNLSLNDIAGTEWPLFGSVFYLWGIENLQAAWDAGDHRTGLEPKVFAKEAILAASELVIDPKHATWVQKHWGTNYLHQENVFYRMLVIAALTTREKLLQDGTYTTMLRDQVETLAQELDASRTGLLNDYPGECYPGDVMTAIACIRRADAVLGTDHSKFVARALRAFTGARATRHQLPPYSADFYSGQPRSEARGCANSYMCLMAPELWPNQARQWYALYDKFFWQQRITAVGYRELPQEVPKGQWGFDVDAGPIIAGHGVAASAFGVGAARKNGRFDRAYPLATEMLATTWELPNGVLAVPRLLSNFSDAPLLGEAAILWLLTIQPEKGFPVQLPAKVPTYTYLVVGSTLLIGALLLAESLWRFRMVRRHPEPAVRAAGLQATLWAGLLLGAAGTFWLGFWWAALGLLIIALVLPIKKKVPADETEEWPAATESDNKTPAPTPS